MSYGDLSLARNSPLVEALQQSEVRVSFLLGLEPSRVHEAPNSDKQNDGGSTNLLTDYREDDTKDHLDQEVDATSPKAHDEAGSSQSALATSGLVVEQSPDPSSQSRSLPSHPRPWERDTSPASIEGSANRQVQFTYADDKGTDHLLLKHEAPVLRAIESPASVMTEAITSSINNDITWDTVEDNSFDALTGGVTSNALVESASETNDRPQPPTKAAIEEDVFTQVSQPWKEQSTAITDSEFSFQVTGPNLGVQGPDIGPPQDQTVNFKAPELTDGPADGQTNQDPRIAAPQSSLWDGMFAEDELMLEESTYDLFAGSASKGLSTTSTSAQGMSWNDMTRDHIPEPFVPEITTETSLAPNLRWSDAPGLEDFLDNPSASDQDVPSSIKTEQPIELSWDDAFAGDDDFLSELDQVSSLDAVMADPDTADSQHAVEERPRSSSIRQSYIPAGQVAQKSGVMNAQRPRTLSAVPQPELPVVNTVESLVRATSNYASPYDMPDDFAKPLPRKRISSGQTNGSFQPVFQTSQTVPQPPTRISSLPPLPMAKAPVKPVDSSGARQGFFEDLPVVTRQRTTTPTGRYAPQLGLTPSPSAPPLANSRTPHFGVDHNEQHHSFLSAPQVPRLASYEDEGHLAQAASTTSSGPQDLVTTTADPTLISGLQAPAKLAPYADETGTLRSSTAPLPPSNRYSPAPASAPASASQAKFVQSGPRPSLQQYAPRTSSPLSYQSITQYSTSADSTSTRSFAQSSPYHTNNRSHSLLEPVQENSAPSHKAALASLPSSQAQASTTISPPPKSGPPSASSSPRKRGNHLGSGYSTSLPMVPPKRSQTSSPNAAIRASRNYVTAIDRPASAQGSSSPIKSLAPSFFPSNASASLPPRMNGPQASQIIAPLDERAADPLQRWRGHPVLSWGSGGMLMTAFPTYLPRYVSGQAHPLMQPGGGQFKIKNLSSASLLPEYLVKFPGPLKKSKKKELLAWLQAGAERLEKHQPASAGSMYQSDVDPIKLSERILLYKVLALAVEHDGVLEGVNQATESIKRLLSQPQVAVTESPDLGRSGPSQILSDAPASIELGPLRSLLKLGEAEKAVWHAVDQRLWGPAFLISSTLSKEIWKQVIQEFVRKEVRDKALAALFQVFAGNWDESVDELVSVSARAGFQMVNTAVGNMDPQDALAGLEKWRETILLILSNRSPGDAQALVAIGRVLAGYGRNEAAHICFIFAGLPGLFGGLEEPSAVFSLVGSSPSALGNDFNGDIEAILLSEVYEHILTMTSTQMPTSPHMQAYKLYHAEVLAENGFRNEAQQYCVSINSVIHSKTNRSPYYNVALMQSVDTLHKRLSETPLDASSSWKPSIDKVSSSLWGKFNSFVAGEEKAEGAANGHATPPDTEQFHRFAGNTPPTAGSPASAPVDIYNMYPSAALETVAATPPPQLASNPYALHRMTSGTVNSRYQPSASSPQSRMSLESPRKSQEVPRTSHNQSLSPRRETSMANTPSLTLQHPYSPNGSMNGSIQNPYQSNMDSAQSLNETSHRENMTLASQPTKGIKRPQYSPYDSQLNEQPAVPYNEPELLLHDDTGSSQPEQPAIHPSPIHNPENSYQPYHYQPYNVASVDGLQEPITSDEPAGDYMEDTKPTKKSFMDDDEEDDDLMKRVASLQKEPAPVATREPDEAVRRAAEADAARPQPTLNHKSSWFGGLGFFGKKQADPIDPRKPVKANLGEKSSFVFDPELKKWVNKAAGAAAVTTPTLTPPPPRSIPSRAATPAAAASSSIGPPRPASSVGTAPPLSRTTSFQNPDSRPSTSGGRSPAPPMSRSGTTMSNSSDIDDLLGGPAPRSRGGPKPKKKGRYVDVMANKPN